MFLLAAALAQDAPETAPGAPRQRNTTVQAGLGAGFLIGGNGSGYGAAFAEQLAVDFSLGGVGALSLHFDHSRHSLLDGGAYFADLAAPADAIEGSRDYLVADGGVKLDVLLPREHPGTVRAVPYVRFGAGGAFTDTKLDVPSFDGRQEIRSRAVAPLLSLGAGVTIHFGELFSILPGAKLQGLIARDDGEIDKQTSVGIEMRGQVTIDAALTF